MPGRGKGYENMSKLDKRAICMVVYNRYPSDPRVRRAAEALVRNEYKVHVVCSSEPGQPDTDEFNGVKIHRVHVPKQSGAKWSNALAMLLFLWQSMLRVNVIHRQFSPAYYHIHSLPDFLVGVALWPKLKGAKIVLDLHESFPEIVLARFHTSSRLFYSIAAWLERLSCLVSDQIIVVNETIRNLVIKRGENAARVTVVMNSPMITADSGALPPVHPAVSAARNTGLPLFVYAGGINAERDLVALVHAVAILKKKGLALNVLFFTHTETPFVEVLKKQINEEQLDGLMVFCGVLPAEEVLANVKQSDIGIVSYEKSPLTEVALPNKVFEYMATEVPIISADLPTLRELMGDSARYYEPGSAQSLSEQIELVLVGDKEKSARISKAKCIFESCRWGVMEKRLLEIYSQL